MDTLIAPQPATGLVLGVLRLVDGSEVLVTTDGLFEGSDPWAFFAEPFAELTATATVYGPATGWRSMEGAIPDLGIIL